MIEARIKEARFPTVKSLDSFDFLRDPLAQHSPIERESSLQAGSPP